MAILPIFPSWSRPHNESPIPTVTLDVIDLSEAAMACPERRVKARDQIVTCFSSLGFCQVSGMKDYSAEKLLEGSKWFFSEVPEEARLAQLATKAYNPSNPNFYRGYFPAQPDRMSYKRGYDVGLQWEIPEHLKGIPLVENTPMLSLEGHAKKVEDYYQVLFQQRDTVRNVGDLIMTLIAEAGGEDEEYFKEMFSVYPQHTLRPIMYPTRNGNIPKGAALPDGRVISTPAHADSGFLTLLQTFNYPGLEIEVNGEWFAVPPNPETLVVNIGEQMAEMSNGRFKATVHRVMDIGATRYSMPFFYEPGVDSNINFKIPNALLPAGSQDKFDTSYYPYGTFLFFKLPIYAEYSQVSDNLPEWAQKKYLENYTPKKFWAAQTGTTVDGETYMERKLRLAQEKQAAQAKTTGESV
eukprot:maker-scaffold309_size213625-snap-gene-1.22 protein:Tk02555 transcript:maker-scaffold309_size213625-snap-gene-1.22-mRNA-1 annotation:"2og-fe oxygenase"